jgi:DNA polymerase (family 10)
MTMPPGAAGTYLVHFTGSAAHNVRLREMARDRGWSLSEHGFTSLDDETERVTFETEEEVYEFLGLPFIEPELREDRGEIEAALAHSLPDLVAAGDIRADLHMHSRYSDGAATPTRS